MDGNPEPARVSGEELGALRDRVDSQLPTFIAELEALVSIDSGSYTKAGVDRVGRWIGAALGELGGRVEYRAHGRYGDTLVASFGGRPSGGARRALLIGHLDTVFEPGTAAARPFRITGGRAYGPGVTDMKSGLLAGVHALRALRETLGEAAQGLPFERLVFIANPDEEVGSPSSTPYIREAALASDVALVLECARANGDVVSARKGVIDVELLLTGRAAHAGIEPEKGRSAILEAAHKTIALHELPRRSPGVTCNVGVIRGGTRPNVVPESAVLEVDLRAPTREGFEAAEGELRAIAGRAFVPDVACELIERARHEPMEKSAASARLVAQLQGLAERLGLSVNDAATGGASDANTTAGLGVPTLDGLGPVGGEDHSPREYLELDSVGPRVTLLAALLLGVGRHPSFAPEAGRERRRG